jgi:hypothetical protein
MKVRIETPEIGKSTLDVRGISRRMAISFRNYYAGKLNAGQRSDGRGQLPTNSQGQPYGRGDKTIVRNWQVGPTRSWRAAGMSRAFTEVWPFQEGKYYYPIAIGEDRKGIDWQSLEGQAEALLDDIVEQELSRLEF